MAYDIHNAKEGSLAHIQASCLPEIAWTYEPTSAALSKSVLTYRAFKAWHQAYKHGFKLNGIMYHGEVLTGAEVDGFNLFVHGGCALPAGNMEHWAASNLFDRIRAGSKAGLNRHQGLLSG
jgi:hypothetical protein